jgi:ketosteroid isomerase-like protein
MPWFPEFVGAVELVRRQTRVEGRRDPVGQYVAALDRGDTRALEDVWPAEVVVFDPVAGQVRGHGELRRFVRRSRELLAARGARIDTVASTTAGDRAVVELLVRLTGEGADVAWPVAIVAESPDDRSVTFRSYFSRIPVSGRRHLRPAILEPGGGHPGDVVGRYHTALAAGDVDALVGAFAPEAGYLREAVGPQCAHRGTDALRALFAGWCDGGGVTLEPCSVTDDHVRCAVEYNCVRRGGHDVPSQAGVAVYRRSAGGLLAAAHVYDDLDAPAGHMTR